MPENEAIKQFEENLQKNAQMLEDIQKGLKGKVDAETLKGVTDQLDEIKSTVASFENVGEKSIVEYVKGIQEHADSLETQLNEMKKSKGVKDPTLADKVKNLTQSEAWVNYMKSMKSGETSSRREFTIEKAANDLLTSDWTAADGTVGLPQMAIPGVTKHPWKETPIYSAIPKRTVGMYHEVKYTEELTRSDAAAVKAEGSQYAQSGATWITRPLEFYDIGHYAKVTRESLEDAEYIQQEINDLLYNGLLRKVENLLVTGSGTNTIEGILTAGKDFAKTQGMNSVASPTIRDMLLAGQLQVAKGVNAVAGDENADTGKTGYNANMAIVGKATRYNITTEKDDIGRPIVEDINNWRPGGMNVVTSEDLTENETTTQFAVFDINKAMLYMKRNLILETGYDGNDFTYGMVTIRASIRMNMLIKNLEKYAFVQGNLKDTSIISA